MKADSIWWLLLPFGKNQLTRFCCSRWFSLPSSTCALVGVLLCHRPEVWNVSFGCNIDFDLWFFLFVCFLWGIYLKAESLILIIYVFFFLFFFNWSIVSLQCSVSFSCTPTAIFWSRKQVCWFFLVKVVFVGSGWRRSHLGIFWTCGGRSLRWNVVKCGFLRRWSVSLRRIWIGVLWGQDSGMWQRWGSQSWGVSIQTNKKINIK